MKVLIAYIPVIHKGYLDLFRESKAKSLYIIGEDLIQSISELDYVARKDSIRALPADVMVTTVSSLSLFDDVQILTRENISSVVSAATEIHMPREDVSEEVSQQYFSGKDVTYHNIFLRWNKTNVENKVSPTCEEVSLSEFESMVMGKAFKVSEKSTDWWRHVGAVVIKDNEIIMTAFNKHFPSEQSPYIVGDTRSVFHKGINVELCTAEHAEARIIAEAAKQGIPLEGTDIFVTDFPCPPCARLIAGSGVKKLYFKEGYAMLDGEEVLKDKKVEIIAVK